MQDIVFQLMFDQHGITKEVRKLIELKTGNLLTAEVDALVNTVNCVGVMGKGIALQFKQAFPKNFTEYNKACKANNVKPGKMFTVSVGGLLVNPRYIINFPTKRHWKGNSRMEDIDSGLVALVKEIKDLGINSIAIPPLGCGNGGLDWNVVRTKIEVAFKSIPDVKVYLYSPSGSPAPEEIKIATKKPHLTMARALLISLMDRYGIPGYRLTLLEVQKLAYFLQEAGEPLKLKFEKGTYGPYAENLNFVLQVLEGHYIRGVGDGSRKKDVQVYLLQEAATKATEFLKDQTESIERLQHVSEIIMGFESPYGMELLATVHWTMKENPNIVHSPSEVIKAVYDWNDRKRTTFKESHIETTWKHLRNLDFLKFAVQ